MRTAMGFRSSVLLLVVLSMLVICPPAIAGNLRNLGQAGDWVILGAKGHCQIGRALPGGQFGLGLSGSGSFMTFQKLGWQLPRTPGNVMPVTVKLDGKSVLRTEALIIAPAAAFQVFPDLSLTAAQVRSFWSSIQKARTLKVKVPFQSRNVAVDLRGMSGGMPILRKCTAKYLKGVAVPF